MKTKLCVRQSLTRNSFLLQFSQWRKSRFATCLSTDAVWPAQFSQRCFCKLSPLLLLSIRSPRPTRFMLRDVTFGDRSGDTLKSEITQLEEGQSQTGMVKMFPLKTQSICTCRKPPTHSWVRKSLQCKLKPDDVRPLAKLLKQWRLQILAALKMILCFGRCSGRRCGVICHISLSFSRQQCTQGGGILSRVNSIIPSYRYLWTSKWIAVLCTQAFYAAEL